MRLRAASRAAAIAAFSSGLVGAIGGSGAMGGPSASWYRPRRRSSTTWAGALTGLGSGGRVAGFVLGDAGFKVGDELSLGVQGLGVLAASDLVTGQRGS